MNVPSMLTSLLDEQAGGQPMAEPMMQMYQPFQGSPESAGQMRTLMDMIRDKQAENRAGNSASNLMSE